MILPPRDDGAPSAALMWGVAAVALVAGILIGFTSGFATGRRSVAAPAAMAPVEVPRTPAEVPAARAVTPEAPGQPFTEDVLAPADADAAAAAGPSRVEPEPIRPPPDANIPEPVSEPVEEPASAAAPLRRAEPASEAVAAPRAEPVPAPAGPGSIQVLSRPAGAAVTADGRVAGRTPLVLATVDPGPHRVRIELAGFRVWATTVEVTAGERTRVAASLEP